MDRGAWWATDHGQTVRHDLTTEHACRHGVGVRLDIEIN